MKDLIDKIKAYLDEGLAGMTVSGPRKSEEIKKYTIRPVLLKKELCFQAAGYTSTQVFHRNLSLSEMEDWLRETLPSFRQVQLRHRDAELTAMISKKGNATVKVKKHQPEIEAPALVRLSHNKEKNYILKEGMDVPFLRDLGVMTAEGKIVRSRYDKYRQINRFLEFIEDVVPHLPRDREITVIDFGCGKSYLTFAMYYDLKILKKLPVRIIGLDLKKDVIRRCSMLAESYGYDRLSFRTGSIEDYRGTEQADMVVTLHACDTATDYAIAKAIGWGAKVILSVPCCQHEINGQISSDGMDPIFDYGILKERFSALATDGIRAKILEASGYETRILEFIDMEHTPKNLLIRAVHKNFPSRDKLEEVESFCRGFSIQPTLLTLMKEEEGRRNS